MTFDTGPGRRSTGRDVALLAAANGLGISTAVVSVTVSALAGAEICTTSAQATLPYGMQFLALLGTTLPASLAMQRFGRRPVFLAAAGAGVAAGIVGSLAIGSGSLALLCLAHVLLGIMLANVNFFRFAALEVGSAKHRASAMSLVLFGGTFAALIGPAVSRSADLVLPGSLFAAAYLGIAVLSAVIAVLVALVRFPAAAGAAAAAGTGLRAGLGALATGTSRVGLAAGALGYGAMNLLMIACSLAMREHDIGFTSISYAIQAHVLAMFVPSLVMGRIIERIGALPVAAGGAALMILSGMSALALANQAGFIAALFLLGLGWNALYVGGSTIVAADAPAELKFQVQGANDLVVGVLAMLGAFLPGLLIDSIGWQGLNLGSMAVFMVFIVAVAAVMPRPRLAERGALR